MNDKILFSSNDSNSSKPIKENSNPDLKAEVDPVVPNQVNEAQTQINNIIMPESEINPTITKKEINNLFKGRAEADIENAKFPTWDIEPPNQFINPRLKTK